MRARRPDALSRRTSRRTTPATFEGQETGTLEELRIAGEQVVTGASDDLFIYFKTTPAPGEANLVNLDRVRQLRDRLDGSKEAFIAEFNTQLEFETVFRRPLRLWIERWIGIPEICEFALDHSGGSSVPATILSDARLHAVLCSLDLAHVRAATEVLGRFATEIYQREVAWVRPLTSGVVRNSGTCPITNLGVSRKLRCKPSPAPEATDWHRCRWRAPTAIRTSAIKSGSSSSVLSA